MFGRKHNAMIHITHKKGSIEVYDKILDMIVLRATVGSYNIYVYIDDKEAIKLAQDILKECGGGEHA